MHTGKKFENISYEDKYLNGRIFKNCTFYKSSLKGCVFEDSSFDDCVFDDCDLSLLKLKSTSFSRVTLKNCKAIGIIWADALNPFSIAFQQSRISFSSFYGKNLKKAQFIQCIADEVDFSECNLSQADFSGTELTRATFSNTDLTKANFTGATNYFIDARTNKLQKAKFSLPEALSFLYAMGIELDETSKDSF